MVQLKLKKALSLPRAASTGASLASTAAEEAVKGVKMAVKASMVVGVGWEVEWVGVRCVRECGGARDGSCEEEGQLVQVRLL